MDIHEIAPDESTHTMWEPPGSGYGEESGVSADHGLDDTTGLDGPGHDTPGQDDTTSPDGGPDAAPGGTDSTDSTGGQSTGSDSGGTNTGSMTVEVEGQSRTLPTSHDYTGDGRPDATVQTEDGKLIVFADTDNNTTGDGAPDGKADQAIIVNPDTGQVEGTAHVDPSTGEWVDGPADGSAAPTDSTGTEGGETDGTQVGTGGTGGDDGTDARPDMVTVEVDGHEIGVAKTVDANSDGTADTGLVESDGRVIAITDTDGDGDGDRAAVFDSTGHVVGTMHVDPSTGEWVEDSGGGSDDGTQTAPTDDGSGGTPASGSMTVEVEGQTRTLPTSHDYTGDGRPDATVQTEDGKLIVFADTDNNTTGDGAPDGKADQAIIVNPDTGQVEGTAHVDPSTGEWVDGPADSTTTASTSA